MSWVDYNRIAHQYLYYFTDMKGGALVIKPENSLRTGLDNQC